MHFCATGQHFKIPFHVGRARIAFSQKRLVGFAQFFIIGIRKDTAVAIGYIHKIAAFSHKGMGVFLSFCSGSATVNDSDIAGEFADILLLQQHLKATYAFFHINFVFMDGGNAGIVAGVPALLLAEHFHNNGSRLFRSHITCNITHCRSPLAPILNKRNIFVKYIHKRSRSYG